MCCGSRLHHLEGEHVVEVPVVDLLHDSVFPHLTGTKQTMGDKLVDKQTNH